LVAEFGCLMSRATAGGRAAKTVPRKATYAHTSTHARVCCRYRSAAASLVQAWWRDKKHPTYRVRQHFIGSTAQLFMFRVQRHMSHRINGFVPPPAPEARARALDRRHGQPQRRQRHRTEARQADGTPGQGASTRETIGRALAVLSGQLTRNALLHCRLERR